MGRWAGTVGPPHPGDAASIPARYGHEADPIVEVGVKSEKNLKLVEPVGIEPRTFNP